MKQILVINAHSFVDLITNSSSELFVCNTNKSVDMVEVLLRKMLDLHNEIRGTERRFDDCFGGVYAATDATDYLKSLAKSYDFSFTKGQIIIESQGDNSIPYELFDMIESAFEARRHHLG
jgi:hypothetical protein